LYLTDCQYATCIVSSQKTDTKLREVGEREGKERESMGSCEDKCRVLGGPIALGAYSPVGTTVAEAAFTQI
jgi:hypothetical protein